MAPPSTPLSASPPSPGSAQDGGATLLAQPGSGDPGRADCLVSKGPAALPAGSATFNDCGGRAHARTAQSTGGLRIDTAGNQSGPQSPIGSGAVHPSFASAPGAGLPEFRALLFLVSWPLFVIAFTSAVIWIFL